MIASRPVVQGGSENGAGPSVSSANIENTETGEHSGFGTDCDDSTNSRDNDKASFSCSDVRKGSKRRGGEIGQRVLVTLVNAWFVRHSWRIPEILRKCKLSHSTNASMTLNLWENASEGRVPVEIITAIVALSLCFSSCFPSVSTS